MTAINKNKNYRLSIQFALDGFSFLVYNPKKNKLVLEKEMCYTGKEKFYDWFKIKLAAEEAFRKTYASIKVMHTPEKYTLVPNEFIKKEKQKQLFMLSFPLEETEMIETETLENMTMLSCISCDSYNLVSSYFPKAEWKTTPTFLLQHLKQTKEWSIGFLILYNKLQVTVKKENIVQLNNSFQFQTKDDLLYYMLYVFDNFNIPVSQSSIQLFGNQNYLPLLAKELSKYHNDIQLPKASYGLATHTPMGNLLLKNL